MSKRVLVATVGPARGLVGEVLVRPHTDRPEERFATGAALYLDDGRRLDVARLRYIKKRWCLTFSQVADRDGAEALRGRDLYALADEDEGAGSAEDGFYPAQLRGFSAVDTAGAALGRVTDVELGAAQDLLVVEARGGQTVRVPFVRALVPRVDVGNRVLVLDPPAGLFPEAADG